MLNKEVMTAVLGGAAGAWLGEKMYKFLTDPTKGILKNTAADSTAAQVARYGTAGVGTAIGIMAVKKIG